MTERQVISGKTTVFITSLFSEQAFKVSFLLFSLRDDMTLSIHIEVEIIARQNVLYYWNKVRFRNSYHINDAISSLMSLQGRMLILRIEQ